jgi:hypothetical protein
MRGPLPGCFLGPWIVLLGACFQPDLDAAHYACDPALLGTDCPQGFYCAAGTCRRPPDLSSGADLRSPDLLRAPHDLRSSPPDLGSPADLLALPDLSLSRPCSSGGGTTLVVGVHACPGAFAAGQYATLCGAGSHVCSTTDAANLSQLTAALCHDFNGFFASQVEGGVVGALPVQSRCPYVALDERALIGCGVEAGAVQVTTALGCDDLFSAVPCKAGATPWSCSTGIENAAHTAVVGGVLCCDG